MWVSKLTGNIDWERHAVNVCGITDGAVGTDAAKKQKQCTLHILCQSAELTSPAITVCVRFRMRQPLKADSYQQLSRGLQISVPSRIL